MSLIRRLFYAFINERDPKEIKEDQQEQKQLITKMPPTLPEIDARKPLVSGGLTTDPAYYDVTQTASQEERIQKSCAVCKFAMHDENLEDLKSIVCTVNPNKPEIKSTGDTCLQHVSKYPKLKVFVDNDNLMEYDSSMNDPKKDHAKTVAIGEDQWQS